MDNDLMARRLYPPSQPTPPDGESPVQPPLPLDFPSTDDGSLAPAEQQPQEVPPSVPPDPAARADVPWDRPAPEAWPPADDSGADSQQTWLFQADVPASPPAQTAWPATDAVGDAALPWDRPTSDQSLDPDDAMAPVVGDVNTPAGVRHQWSGSGGNGIPHATVSTPEPMTVAAHGDLPRGGDEPRPDALADAFDTPTASPGAAIPGDSGPSLPEWPAEDDLTPPSSSRDPVMPEDSREAETTDHVSNAAAEPVPAPDQPIAPQPVVPPPTVTPVITSAQIVPSPAGSPQNMVLRIELALVEESHRANPADAANRVRPDADVRASEYNPRTHDGRAPMPEYNWRVPPVDVQEQQRQQRQGQQPRHVAAPPSAWQPAPAGPTQMDWDLPQVGGPQPDQPPPAAPPPTWALTEPTPPYTPEPPQYTPPSASRYQQPAPYQPAQQPAWPPSQSSDPLYGLPAAPNEQPAGHSPIGAVPSVQPAAATAAEEDPGLANRRLNLMTAGLTVGFALLVVVLVLVFIQLMTSLLR